MPYSDHVKPVKTAVDASQLDGYEELLERAAEWGMSKAAMKQLQSQFFRDLWAKGTWTKDGLYFPMWLTYLVYGHPTDNELKQLQEDSLFFANFVVEKLMSGQIVPVLELAKLFQKRLEKANEQPA